MEKHKFEPNKKYYTISLYVIGTVLFLAILIKIIWKWSSTISTIEKTIDLLSPFLMGLFIAYLMNPLVKMLDKGLFLKLLRIKKGSVRKGLSILLSYVVVFGIVAFCISIIVPEVYSSLKNIYDNINTTYDKLLAWLVKFSEKHPDMDISYIYTIVNDNSAKIIEFVQGSLDKILPLLYNTSVSVITWALNFLIAVMVSCYMLIDKERLLFGGKRLIYTLFKKERSDELCSTLKECNKIFGNFIIGKTIDSVIIGFMCFLFMNMLGLKYTMLISVVVGITNMIPYFGPFIGAIPGVLILLTESWKYALVFGILILILQQFDGLYLGPKILGESTGLRPVWIIFSITVGGWLCGPIGMFLGVPCIAVISFLVNRKIDRVLEQKKVHLEISTNNQDNPDNQTDIVDKTAKNSEKC